jgi:hypothetical protein
MRTSAADIANRPLVICGMHRSGTSLTASLFGGAGVNLGDRLVGPNVGNSLGHFEDVSFLEFHMRVLRGEISQLIADPAAARADHEALASQLALVTSEQQRLARALEQAERERDWLAHEKLQLATESERLALALTEATSGPLHRLAGSFQARSSTGRAA